MGLFGWMEALTCVVETQLQERYEVHPEVVRLDVETQSTILVPAHGPFELSELLF
jgi:hypothetical protein